MGIADRVLRILIVIAIITLYYTNVISGVLAIILLTLALIFLITSFVGFCPLYLPFGLVTKKNKSN